MNHLPSKDSRGLSKVTKQGFGWRCRRFGGPLFQTFDRPRRTLLSFFKGYLSADLTPQALASVLLLEDPPLCSKAIRVLKTLGSEGAKHVAPLLGTWLSRGEIGDWADKFKFGLVCPVEVGHCERDCSWGSSGLRVSWRISKALGPKARPSKRKLPQRHAAQEFTEFFLTKLSSKLGGRVFCGLGPGDFCSRLFWQRSEALATHVWLSQATKTRALMPWMCCRAWGKWLSHLWSRFCNTPARTWVKSWVSNLVFCKTWSSRGGLRLVA